MHINVTILFILCQLAVSPVCDATAALYGSNLITQHFDKNKFLIFSSEDAHYEVSYIIRPNNLCLYLSHLYLLQQLPLRANSPCRALRHVVRSTAEFATRYTCQYGRTCA